MKQLHKPRIFTGNQASRTVASSPKNRLTTAANIRNDYFNALVICVIILFAPLVIDRASGCSLIKDSI